MQAFGATEEPFPLKCKTLDAYNILFKYLNIVGLDSLCNWDFISSPEDL